MRTPALFKNPDSTISTNGRDHRTIPETLSPLEQLCETSANLVRKPLPAFQNSDRDYFISRYLFLGPKGGADPIRVGLFAGVHGDEPEGSLALIEFLQNLDSAPIAARDFCLFIYPILNPTGFEAKTRDTADGVSIPSELWKNSTSTEVQQIQSELWMHAFDGIVSLKTAPAASELLIEVGGPIFARHLFQRALFEAQDLLPQLVNTNRDALPRLKNTLLDQPNDLIRAAPGLRSRPFEIVITIPGKSPAFLQRAAVGLVLKRVLGDYRDFISYGANI